MACLCDAIRFSAAGVLFAFAAGAQPDVDARDLPHFPPVAAANALQTFQLKNGFRLQLVAAEPLVTDPIAMSFDENGRLFVIEMRDYSERRDETPHLGQIRCLVDTNNDGIFDTSTVFAKNLPWPSAIACYNRGVFVAATPDVFFINDLDGDGLGDEKRAVFTGFGSTAPKLNVQALVNSFTWGLDNRIHGATAGNGGEVNSLVSPLPRPLNLRGKDFSFDPRALTITAESGTAQFGLSFDNRGRKFVCDNSHHAKLVMYELRYATRNPYYAMPPPLVDIAPPAAPIYRISPDEPWRVIRTRWRTTGVVPSGGIQDGGGRVSGYFSAAGGVMIYRGNTFPADYFEDLFVTDCGGNLVHRDKLMPRGLELVAQRPGDEANTEFLASRDTWCRPVALANGPDGALYVADMYREIIEHPWALPDAIKKHLNLNSGNDRGRIYRVVPSNFKQPPPVRLGKLATPELVATLAHPNGWHRDTAARLIYERQDKGAVPELARLLITSLSPFARMHALHALDGLGALTETHISRGLKDGDERVREHAVLLSEKLVPPGAPISDSLWNQLRALTADPAPRVRYQLAFTLGETRHPAKAQALAVLANRDFEDKWMRAAVLSSLADGAADVFAIVFNDPRVRNSESGGDLLRQLGGLIGTQHAPGGAERALNLAAQLDARETQLGFSLINALGDGLRRGNSSLTAADAKGVIAPMIANATLIAVDSGLAEPLRVEAIRLTGQTRFQDSAAVLFALLNVRESAVVQSAALRTLARYTEPEVGAGIVQRWASLRPSVRGEALTVLLERPERAAALLAAMDGGLIPRAVLNFNQVAALTTHKDQRVRPLAERVFGKAAMSSRQEVMEQFKPTLKLPGVAARGRGIFSQRCAICHQLGGEGRAVGPDLASARLGGKEKMLTSILDPNREVAPAYLAYVIETKDGETLSGVIVSETGVSVLLRQAGGGERLVLNKSIETMQSQGLSLMPEGLETGLTPQDMADLLEYVMTAR